MRSFPALREALIRGTRTAVRGTPPAGTGQGAPAAPPFTKKRPRVWTTCGTVAALALACDGSEPPTATSGELWGQGRVAAALKTQAEHPIDPYTVHERPDAKERVLGMSFAEVATRLGHLEFQCRAEFRLTRNGHDLRVTEDTLLKHGRYHAHHLLQKDADGALTREVMLKEGRYYFRNGPGALRDGGPIQKRHTHVLEEAYKPLRAYTDYFGIRVGLQKVGRKDVTGRGTALYRFVLLDGSQSVVSGQDQKPKTPMSLAGSLYVDEATGVALQATLQGTLGIPGEDGQPPGKLELKLHHQIRAVPGLEIPLPRARPRITRRPIELDPLAFLGGRTRTSTTIGGKGTKPKNRTPKGRKKPRAKTQKATP